MLPPPNSFLSHFQQPRVLQLVTAVKGNNHCSNTYNFSDFSPCCSTAILPIVVTELTEYNCQSVLFVECCVFVVVLVACACGCALLAVCCVLCVVFVVAS